MAATLSGAREPRLEGRQRWGARVGGRASRAVGQGRRGLSRAEASQIAFSRSPSPTRLRAFVFPQAADLLRPSLHVNLLRSITSFKSSFFFRLDTGEVASIAVHNRYDSCTYTRRLGVSDAVRDHGPDAQVQPERVAPCPGHEPHTRVPDHAKGTCPEKLDRFEVEDFASCGLGTCPEKLDRFEVEDFASCGLGELPLSRELPRGNVPQRAVRPVLVVVSLPLQNLALCVSDREEQLDVEMLIP